MSLDHRLRRCRFRAWHRGTREMDFMIGGYFDRYQAEWNEEQLLWFERFLDEEDPDIMGWIMGTQTIPDVWQGPMMDALRKLDFVEIPR